MTDLPDGYYSDAELAWLTDAVRRRAPRTLVEIGTCMGRSALAIACAMRPTAHLWCIDIWPDERALRTFRYAVEQAGLADRITAVRQPSGEAARAWRSDCGLRNADCGMDSKSHGSTRMKHGDSESESSVFNPCSIRGQEIDLVHLDGDHRSLAVYLDIREWLPSLAPDGIFLGHDWNLDSVRFGVMQAKADGLLGEIGVSAAKRNGLPACWWGLPATPGTCAGSPDASSGSGACGVVEKPCSCSRRLQPAGP
ncbi:MAG: class I SAM-dependent methyltransferase [Planctomycetota bacterium]